MPKFRDFLKTDLNTFINSDEFATNHNVNGNEINIVIDTEFLKERSRKMSDPDGTYKEEILFHVKKDDFEGEPAIRSILKLDNTIYRISDVQEDEYMYTITLVGNGS